MLTQDAARRQELGSLSIWHWLIVLAVILLLFGGGKVSTLMGDFAKGIKAFKKNMAEDHDVSMEGDGRASCRLHRGAERASRPRHRGAGRAARAEHRPSTARRFGWHPCQGLR